MLAVLASLSLIGSSRAFAFSPISHTSSSSLTGRISGTRQDVCGTRMMSNQQRVAVVTGANKGIGLEVCRILGRVPGVVCIMGCRNVKLGQEAAAGLQREGCNVTFAQLDISDKQSINNFALMIQKNFGGLDILVNNAAIAYKGRDPTPFQQQARPTLMTNFYGTLNLTESLAPLLRSGARVSNVASMSGPLKQFPRSAHERVLAPDFSRAELCGLVDNFIATAEAGTHSRAGWPNTCYGVSKAAINAYTRILARDLSARGILVNSCCPGWCATDMSSHSGPRSAAQGADTPAFLALLADGSPTGEYWTDRRIQNWSLS